jgi:hypothetical protein
MVRFTGRRRLSLRSRSAAGLLAISAVFCAIWWLAAPRSLAPPSRVEVAREVVSFATLRPEEEIVVTLAREAGPPLELRFRSTGESREMIVSELRWSEFDRAWKMQRVLARQTIGASSLQSLDRVLAHLRAAPPAAVSGPAVYTIVFRRDEAEVARENFASTPLLRAHAAHAAAAARASADAELGREAIVREAGLAGLDPAEVAVWMTFELLLPPEQRAGF